MNNSFIVSLRKEIAELQHDLSRDPRYVKLGRLQDVLELYAPADGTDVPHNAINHDGTRHTSASSSDSVAPSPKGRQLSDMRLRAVEFASDYLRGRSEPTPTREILLYIQREGLEISGKNPVSNLSAILSKSEGFESVGRSGWKLAQFESQRSGGGDSVEALGDALDIDGEGDVGRIKQPFIYEQPHTLDRADEDLL